MHLSLWTRWGIALVLIGAFFGIVSAPAWGGLAVIGAMLLLYAGVNRLDQKDKQHRANR